MAGIIRVNKLLFNRSPAITSIPITQQFLKRLISTSQKNKEAAAVSAGTQQAATTKTTTAADESKTVSKNWVSYGFDYRDETIDKNAMKSSYFFSVTLCLVWGTFIWSYLPDPIQRDWAQREGYLLLREREAAGLEPINRDYVDPALIQLPSDEELGNQEIII